MWGRQSYRLSEFDFEANARDGVGIDWPIRYADLAPWYDHVERHAGISGSREGMPQLPDGQFQPPMPLNCGEEVVASRLTKRSTGGGASSRRTANSPAVAGRSPCRTGNACWPRRPYGAYFSPSRPRAGGGGHRRSRCDRSRSRRDRVRRDRSGDGRARVDASHDQPPSTGAGHLPLRATRTRLCSCGRRRTCGGGPGRSSASSGTISWTTTPVRSAGEARGEEESTNTATVQPALHPAYRNCSARSASTPRIRLQGGAGRKDGGAGSRARVGARQDATRRSGADRPRHTVRPPSEMLRTLRKRNLDATRRTSAGPSPCSHRLRHRENERSGAGMIAEMARCSRRSA